MMRLKDEFGIELQPFQTAGGEAEEGEPTEATAIREQLSSLHSEK